jgi:hypothetical protein
MQLFDLYVEGSHINKIVLNINVLLSSENSLQALHAL